MVREMKARILNIFLVFLLLATSVCVAYTPTYTMVDVFVSSTGIVAFVVGLFLAFWPVWIFLIGAAIFVGVFYSLLQ